MPAAQPHTDLVLHVQCHAWLVALEADLVQHVALAGEAKLITPPAELGKDAPRALLGVVPFGGRAFAAWDLGVLLGLEEECVAWALMRLPLGNGRTLPIALRNGGCHMVGPLPRSALSRLPACLTPGRPRALKSAYAPRAEHLGRAKEIAAGFELDLARLLSREEIDWSRNVITKVRMARRKER